MYLNSAFRSFKTVSEKAISVLAKLYYDFFLNIFVKYKKEL